jgi:hypothetical protein
MKTKNADMRDLIGKECACTFIEPYESWPFSGWPAWVVVTDVALPMVRMHSIFGGEVHGNPQWVSTHIIKTIRAVGKYSERNGDPQ